MSTKTMPKSDPQENPPRRRPPAASSVVLLGPKGTNIAVRASDDFCAGIREAARLAGSRDLSSWVRDVLEGGVAAQFKEAGKAWPPAPSAAA